jgi:DNA-binding CsgD family transcriptional regulator
VIQLTYDDHLQQEFKEKLKINKLFQILNKYDTYMEGFLFARRDKESIDYLHFFDQMYYLRKFGLYFKLEMKSEIHRILDFEYNMRAALGDQFDTPSVSLPCLGIERKYEQFLQEIDPLSQQENRCINLYKQGHSAQATAAKMGLSQRTVEHYLDNARLKLGLRSKRELLEF